MNTFLYVKIWEWVSIASRHPGISSLHDFFGFHLRSLQAWGGRSVPTLVSSTSWTASICAFQFCSSMLRCFSYELPDGGKAFQLENRHWGFNLIFEIKECLRNVMTALVQLKSQPHCPSCALHRCSSECPPASTAHQILVTATRQVTKLSLPGLMRCTLHGEAVHFFTKLQDILGVTFFQA